MYLVDYHVHTKRCGHACGEDREYLETAIEKSLKEIGFSDHVPCFYQAADPLRPVSEHGMDYAALEEYVRTVLQYRSEYREIAVKLGLEIDFIPGWEETIAEIIASYPWDYVLGSVHFVPEWNYDYIAYDKEHEPVEIFTKYFELVAAAAASGLFDFLGHIDLPKRAFKVADESVMDELHRKLAGRLGKSRAVIEVSTYGIRVAKLGDAGIYPDPGLLRLCRQNGVKVTLGSDAHRPRDVGADFEKSAALLERTGYDRIVTFTRRKAKMVDWR